MSAAAPPIEMGYDVASHDYERAVFLANPGAAQFKKLPDGRTNFGEDVGLGIASVITANVIHDSHFFMTTGNREEDEQALEETLRQGDILIPIGGDGNVNLGINVLGRESLADLVIPIVPIPGGGVNDYARNLIDLTGDETVGDIIKHGDLVRLYSLLYKYRDKSGRAGLYSGVGNVADLARKFNTPGFRGRPGHNVKAVRRSYQGAATLRQFLNTQEFTMTEFITDEEGIEHEEEPRTLNEFVVSNNDIMATFLHFPVTFEDPRAWVTEVAADKRRNVPKFIGQAVTNTTRGRTLEMDETIKVRIDTPAHLHLDGEDIQLEPEEILEISIDSIPYWALSNRLRSR